MATSSSNRNPQGNNQHGAVREWLVCCPISLVTPLPSQIRWSNFRRKTFITLPRESRRREDIAAVSGRVGSQNKVRPFHPVFWSLSYGLFSAQAPSSGAGVSWDYMEANPRPSRTCQLKSRSKSSLSNSTRIPLNIKVRQLSRQELPLIRAFAFRALKYRPSCTFTNRTDSSNEGQIPRRSFEYRRIPSVSTSGGLPMGMISFMPLGFPSTRLLTMPQVGGFGLGSFPVTGWVIS